NRLKSPIDLSLAVEGHERRSTDLTTTALEEELQSLSFRPLHVYEVTQPAPGWDRPGGDDIAAGGLRDPRDDLGRKLCHVMVTFVMNCLLVPHADPPWLGGRCTLSFMTRRPLPEVLRARRRWHQTGPRPSHSRRPTASGRGHCPGHARRGGQLVPRPR